MTSLDHELIESGFESQKTENWINRQRVLLIGSKCLRKNEAQLLTELSSLLAHSKRDCRVEKRNSRSSIEESCQSRNCENFIYLEQRKNSSNLYIGKNKGPTVKFQLCDFRTAEDQNFVGNCLRHSRPLLSFGSVFAKNSPHILLRNILVDIFNIPKNHPKAQPFFDKVFSFELVDNSIEFRVFQLSFTNSGEQELIEIGPRMSLKLQLIFSELLSGECLFKADLDPPAKLLKKKEIMKKKLISGTNKQIKLNSRLKKWEERKGKSTGHRTDLIF